MGMIGILLLITAVSQYGATVMGFTLGAAGAVLTGLGFCPTCTLACLLTERSK